MAQKTPKPIVYCSNHELPKGPRYANPKWFDSVKQDVPCCIVVGSYPAVVAGYKAVGIPVFEVADIDAALKLVDARSKPDFAKVAEDLTGQKVETVKPAPGELSVVKGPGGKLFLAKGNDILSGPFEDEAAANAALAAEKGEQVPGAAEPPVLIPENWKDIPWPDMKALADKFAEKPVATADEAIFAIEFEVERRKEAAAQ